MAVIFKGKSNAPTVTTKSLETLRTPEKTSVSKKNVPTTKNYVQKLAQQAAKTNEIAPTINNGIIKPKYVQDKDVVYKKSGYIKDLLGEEI